MMPLLTRFNHLVRLALFGFSLAAAVPMASAQYFGRNKVEYKNFHYEVLKTEHFNIYFYTEEREVMKKVPLIAERWYARLSKLLEHELSDRQPLIIYGSPSEFRQTNAVPGEPGEGTGGVTTIIKRRIVLPSAGPLAEIDHVIGHELVHAFQFDITGEGNPGVSLAAPSVLRLPLWFIEGMAEYLSLGPVDPNTAMWIRDASAHKLPKVSQLENPRYFPYRYGQALWAYIAGRWGDEVVGQILKAAGKWGNVDEALQNVLKIDEKSLSEDWHQAIHTAYDPLSHPTQPPGDYGHRLISGQRDSGELNVAPALSPDGKQLVFLSSRDLFSIDMFLADAETGKIQRKIVKTAIDPHFDSLEFINSSGAWDAEGGRFVFGAVRQGQAVLALLDVPKTRIEREIAFPQLGEILNPTWSPDGRYIAFSAIVSGLSDLFIYNLATESLRRMTNDAFADLHPAWSPDGRSIAFVTDRFTTDVSDLKMGNYRLALMDAASGAIQALPGFDDAKNINPQWSPDGTSLYFLSDRDGITNIYRLSPDGGDLSQVTNLFTGVSGITALSPAISVALRAERLLFTAYEDGKYNIYVVDAKAVLSGQSLTERPGEVVPALLPPQDRANSELIALLKNPTFGLPAERVFKIAPYHAKLSLDSIAQPYLAAGVDRFGTYVGGGVSLFWSDMLGDRNLATMLQINGGVKDIAALVGYQNSKRRWNWGIVAQQIPYVTGDFASSAADIKGEPAMVEQTFIFRQINRGVSGLGEYPLSRVQRLEFAAGYSNITFDQEIKTLGVSAITGEVLIDQTRDVPSPAALNLGQASAALVYDNTFFGATSPILGQRYRFEVSPMVGSISFYSVLADYRRYFMPFKPFTLAARVIHFGRYGRDAEDDRLSPLFIGYTDLVRGYNTGSFKAGDCSSADSDDCPTFDQLLGSKMLVANLELRFPLFRVLGIGEGFYGILPIELAAFYDAGVAWETHDKASFLGGSRRPVTSVGGTMRLNAFGYFIFEVDFVRPLERPGKGWYWMFSLTSGF